jgi:hypothetical protein
VSINCIDNYKKQIYRINKLRMDASLLALLFAIYVGVMIYNVQLSKMAEKAKMSKNDNNSNNGDGYETTQLLKEKAPITEPIKCGKLSKYGYEFIKCEGEEGDDGSGLMNNIILRWLLLPISILFHLTMPKRLLIITFLISIIWLSGLSYFTVWSIDGLSKIICLVISVSH